jgi:hypothetical protein
MHSGDSYLQSIGKATNHAVLSATEANILSRELQNDSKGFFQSAAVSFVDAIRSIEAGFPSWATVKLYYTVYYALRARLAVEGDCIFYVGKSPKLLCAHAGATTTNLVGTTHKAVLARFQRAHPSDYFLSQDIGGVDPLEWFIERREETNYRVNRFTEPDAPDYLRSQQTLAAGKC